MSARRCGWMMSDEDARAMLGRIEELIRSSEIDARHRDSLVRLRAMLEDDLCPELDGAGRGSGGTRDMSPPGSVLPLEVDGL